MEDLLWEVDLRGERDAILENLAIPRRRPAELPGRDAGGAVEGADEVREIAEADLERDVGDLPLLVAEQPGRAPQPAADEILVRRHAEHAAEQPQEVVRAEPRFTG